MRVIWAPLALERTPEIARYIAADRPAAAARWIDGVIRAVGTLAHSPRRGRMVPEVGRREIREVLYGQYRIIYCLDPKRVVVLTARHGRRAFDAGEVEAPSSVRACRSGGSAEET